MLERWGGLGSWVVAFMFVVGAVMLVIGITKLKSWT